MSARREHRLPVNDESRHFVELLQEVQQIIESRQKYQKQLSDMDKRINSIYHNIEVSSYNAAQICVIYHDLQDALIKRRQAKNMLSAFDALKNHTIGTMVGSTVIDQIAAKIDMSWSSDYTPKF